MKTGKTVHSNTRAGLSNTHHTKDRHRLLLVGILCFLGLCLFVQAKPTDKKKKGTRIDLLHADLAKADKDLMPDVQILVGSVQMKHDSMYMYCDSGMIYEKTNSFEAFNNVRMEQGDTLFIYGDYLFYDGITQLAQLRGNVRMINRKTVLTTDSLNYDRLYNLGYYFEGGTLTDEQNVLTSIWGEYSPATKVAVFNHDVKLVNPKFVLSSDTLKYSTENKIAQILGPSNIVNEKNHIYSERGFYDTTKDQAELLDRSILTNEGKKLIGDSLFYDRKAGYGEAFRNVTMNDSINKNMLTGDYCYYNELTESAMSTQKAVAIDYSQGDSLYIHGDTLKLNSFYLKTDSAAREVRAYHKVRFYRTDVQGVCDSLVFLSKDSCMTMYHDPILWNEGQQLLGEEIRVYMNDSTIDWAHIPAQALTVEMKDSIRFNQVSGKEMKAYFVNKEIRKVDVIGNVQVIYFPEESDGSMIGMNTSESSLLNMYLKGRKLERMVMSPKSNGTLYPLDQAPTDKMKLPTYAWFDYIRPINKDDIFNWRGKKAGQELRKSSRKPVQMPKRELVNKK